MQNALAPGLVVVEVQLFFTGSGRSLKGTVREKRYFFDSASKYIREMPSPRMLFQPEA